MEILFVIFGFIVGFLVGEFVALFRVRKLMMRIAEMQGIDIEAELDKLENNEEEKPEISVHRLEVEQVNDILYLYDRTNDSFVCQAPNIDELATLSKTYKNINAATVIHDKKLFIFSDGVAHEYK